MRFIPACLVKCDEFRLGVQRRAVIEQPPCIFFEGKRFQGRVVYRAILISGIAPGQQRIQPCTKAHLEDVYWTTGCRNLRETMLNENMLRFSERSVARVIGLILGCVIQRMGAVVRDNDPGSHQASRKINATADALTPSSRPTKPSFSLVVAFMETASGSTPMSGASVSRIAST